MLTRIIKQLRGEGEDLQTRTLKAAFWSFLGSTGNGAIRFTSNLILTRILFPEAFGLMATAMLLMTLVQIFSDTGVKTALIQHEDGASEPFINTSFMITLARNFILLILIVSSIKPLVSFYDQVELSPLLWIMSLSFILEALINPALPILIKDLKIEKQVAYNIGSQLAGFIVTLILAIVLRSAQALALGFLMTSLFRVVGSYLIMSYRPSLQWDRDAGRELLHFGKYILLNTMITWAALNIDRLIVGKVLGMEQLGLYNIALYLGIFLTDIMVQVFAQSYFPAVSSIASDKLRVQAIYKRTMQVITTIAVPLAFFLAVFSQDVITLLYDPRYQIAGVALFWISLRSAVQVLVNVQGGTLLALGRPRLVTVSNTFGLLCTLVMLPWLTLRFGLMGTGLAILVSSILTGSIQMRMLFKSIGFSWQIIAEPWIRLVFTGVTIIGLYHVLTLILPHPMDNNILVSSLTTLLSIGLVYLQVRNHLKEILGSFMATERQ